MYYLIQSKPAILCRCTALSQWQRCHACHSIDLKNRPWEAETESPFYKQSQTLGYVIHGQIRTFHQIYIRALNSKPVPDKISLELFTRKNKSISAQASFELF